MWLEPSVFLLCKAQLVGSEVHANGDWDNSLHTFQCDGQDTVIVQLKLPTLTIGTTDTGQVYLQGSRTGCI